MRTEDDVILWDACFRKHGVLITCSNLNSVVTCMESMSPSSIIIEPGVVELGIMTCSTEIT